MTGVAANTKSTARMALHLSFMGARLHRVASVEQTAGMSDVRSKKEWGISPSLDHQLVCIQKQPTPLSSTAPPAKTKGDQANQGIGYCE